MTQSHFCISIDIFITFEVRPILIYNVLIKILYNNVEFKYASVNLICLRAFFNQTSLDGSPA